MAPANRSRSRLPAATSRSARTGVVILKPCCSSTSVAGSSPRWRRTPGALGRKLSGTVRWTAAGSTSPRLWTDMAVSWEMTAFPRAQSDHRTRLSCSPGGHSGSRNSPRSTRSQFPWSTWNFWAEYEYPRPRAWAAVKYPDCPVAVANRARRRSCRLPGIPEYYTKTAVSSLVTPRDLQFRLRITPRREASAARPPPRAAILRNQTARRSLPVTPSP